MTDNFYAPPHSIEAEQAVIGGFRAMFSCTTHLQAPMVRNGAY